MNERENRMRAYSFGRPEWIPMQYSINGASWVLYGKELENIVLRHQRLFPGFKPGDVDWDSSESFGGGTAGELTTDEWGCVWKNADPGMMGIVVQHPLADWDAFANYAAPDSAGRDWDTIASDMAKQREDGKFITGGLEHGHLFLRLSYIRGFENLIYDMADEEPQLWKLIEMVEERSRVIVEKYLAIGVDMMSYPEDLGAQNAPMISPKMFRKYIMPVYRRLMAPARQKKVLVHMHSDGYIFDLLDDLLSDGVDVINLQDLIHGIDEIAKCLKGRYAIDLDIDRQDVTRFGSPGDVDDLIREEVMKLGSPEGGLTMIFGMYPGMPLENAEALMGAMEKYSTYYP